VASEILLIDDDAEFLRILSQVLRDNGFSVESTTSGKAGMAHALARRPGLVVLDLVMPGMRGIEVCQALKQDRQTAGIPILILTANDHEGQEISCLDMGADDYLTKPVNTDRLLAHLRALLRRSRGPDERPLLQLGELELDYASKTVRMGAKEFNHLTPKEFELLYDLARHSPKPRDRAALYRDIWGMEPPSEQSLRTVEVHVRRVRLKLGLRSDNWLTTIPGRGYCLVPPKLRKTTPR
jgi:DNA-binding response OmpR family regulator